MDLEWHMGSGCVRESRSSDNAGSYSASAQPGTSGGESPAASADVYARLGPPINSREASHNAPFAETTRGPVCPSATRFSPAERSCILRLTAPR